jgi:hypothetical protein
MGGEPLQAESNSPKLRLMPRKNLQTILGFGAAFTDASCYLLSHERLAGIFIP